MERENAWKKYEGEKQKEVFDFAEGYKAFLTKRSGSVQKRLSARRKNMGMRAWKM
jgi:hypothetical protein